MTATDADDEVQFLRYALAGPDAALFRLEATSGQLRVGAGTVVDYEQRAQYTVVVTVMDPAGATAEVTVTIVVTDVDEAPVVTGPETVVVVEGAVAVATYTATDPEGMPLMWAVTGPDAGQFAMDAGVVRFREAPDYEHPTDTGGENTYAVTVVVGTAPGAPAATVSVRVQVGDAVGTVVVTPGAGHVGVPRTAMLDELDTPVTGLTWQWEWTAAGTIWGTLTGATAEAYTPRAADIGQRLRVVARYTDGDGTGKQVASAPSAAVTARPRVVGPRGGGGGGSGGGGGGAPAERPAPVGYLENPGAASFQSGIGVLSGWVCDAEAVELEIEAETGAVHRFEAAYGTERLDTLEVCDDTDNGFGLLFNWNRLGDGAHAVVAFVDDVELGRATVTVTTLGEEFLRGVEGECVVEDFPDIGQTVPLAWQQSRQNFVMAGEVAPRGVNRAGVAGVGYLENPGPDSSQSGIGIISGWVCEAETVEIEIGELPVQGAAYGTERLDTESVCGDTDNGFGVLFNWNRLGDGEHTVVAWVDGEELGRATVQVTTLGQEFLRGVEGECVVDDFPIARTRPSRWSGNRTSRTSSSRTWSSEPATPPLRPAQDRPCGHPLVGPTEGSVRWSRHQVYHKQGLTGQTDLVRLGLAVATLAYPRGGVTFLSFDRRPGLRHCIIGEPFLGVGDRAIHTDRLAATRQLGRGRRGGRKRRGGTCL